MEWPFIIWNLFTWVFGLVILLTVLYALSLLRRIAIAIEKIAVSRT